MLGFSPISAAPLGALPDAGLIGASDVNAAVSATAAITYTGTGAVVASIVAGSAVSVSVAGAGIITYTGTAAVVGAVGDTPPETYSTPRFTLRLVPRVNRIGAGLLLEIDRT